MKELIKEIQFNSGLNEETELIIDPEKLKKVAENLDSLKNLKVSPLTKIRLKRAIEDGDLEKIMKMSEKALKEQLVNTFDNRTFLEKVRDFFTDGWDDTVKAFRSNNYQDLVDIPLVQVSLAIGGIALAIKLITVFRNKGKK